MNIKELIGTQAYWTINKSLANEIGIYPTLLLQHFIDLDESFFKGMESGFYQQQHRLIKDLPISEHQLRTATSKLKSLGVLNVKRQGVPPKYHYSLNYETLSNLIFKGSVSKRLEIEQERLRIKGNNKTNNKNTNIDDAYGKIFFRIVDAYPANRIGNRQHGLKKFKNLTMDEAKLAATNLKRYLAVAGEFVKSLQNYIDQKCFAEDWLKAEEETKRKKLDKTNTKTFNKNYNEFI